MATEKELSSTEKLLHVIRGDSDPERGRQELRGASRLSFLRRSVRQKGLTVGIDIGYSRIRLVTVEPSSHKKWRLVNYASLPIPDDAPRGTPKFKAFLKGVLARHCGPPGSVNLWAMMSAAEVEVRSISVPRVARKELDNVVYWSAKKDLPFEDDQTVFDFEVQGEIVESGIEKLGILFYAAPKRDVEDMKAIFASLGYPLTGLTVPPLALQNIFRSGWISTRQRTVASLYIGRGWSRIDIFSAGNLTMTRGIKAGLNSMAESLVDEYAKWRKQADISKRQASISSRQDTVIEVAAAPDSLSMDQARLLLEALSPDSALEDDPISRLGLDRQRVFQMITPALERMVRQVERTFEHYTVNMGRESISALYLSTAMNTYEPMADYISSQLGIPAETFDPLDPDHVSVEGLTSQETTSERSACVPALGVSLSDNERTLNLIFTRKDRAARKKYLLANYTAAAFFCLLIAVSFGWYLWLDSVAGARKDRVAVLEESLARNAHVNETLLLGMAANLRTQQQSQTETKRRFLAAALFSEVSGLTPEGIKLTSFRADLGRTATGAAAGPAARTGPAGSAMMDGFVTGHAENLNTDLIDYVIRLQESPLFNRVSIQAKHSQILEGEDVLRFSLAASLNGALQ